MDLNEVERINFNALGGADLITVNDLTGTDVSEVNIGLASAGIGDGAADNVVVTGTTGDDVIARDRRRERTHSDGRRGE